MLLFFLFSGTVTETEEIHSVNENYFLYPSVPCSCYCSLFWACPSGSPPLPFSFPLPFPSGRAFACSRPRFPRSVSVSRSPFRPRCRLNHSRGYLHSSLFHPMSSQLCPARHAANECFTNRSVAHNGFG